MRKLNIRYWDPSRMRDGAVCLVVGRRGSGKSTLMQDLLSYSRDCKRGVCVSATERANPFWRNLIPSCFIYDEYSDMVTSNLFDMQRRVKKSLGHNEPAFAIYDDCMFDRNFVKSKMTKRLLYNGRHDKIRMFMSAQFLTDLPPSLRSQCDYVVVLQDNIKANRERIYAMFGGVFDSFEEFDSVMQQCTQNREAMVLDQTCLSYNPSDAVYFYKATPDLKYQLCAPEYWNYSAKLHKRGIHFGGIGGGVRITRDGEEEEEEEEEDEDDLDSFVSSRFNSTVKVHKQYPGSNNSNTRKRLLPTDPINRKARLKQHIHSKLTQGTYGKRYGDIIRYRKKKRMLE